LPAPEINPSSWSLLRNCRALTALSDAALQELCAAAEERSFQPGEAMVTQGEPAEGLLILLEGSAHARLRGAEGDHCIGRFTSGDLVGEMALVTREARSADVLADSPVRVLLVPTAAFDRLAVRHLELGMVLTQLVAERLGQGAHDGFGGKQVEGFRILRCIGRGGMSIVYRAQDEVTGELVALKMMSYRLIYDAPALARFHQEARLLQGLAHENIARLKRLFPAYHTYFLVMELCEGADLSRLIHLRGARPESQVRPILGQLARALEYLHSRGLVHRDLKPANVMITREGQVKLTDFGLAMPVVVSDEGETRAVDQALMGTPAFMAPEQLSGEPLDGRTDIYALGCLAYELLTGQGLFGATNLFELVRAKLTMRLPAAEAIGMGISAELHAFLQDALQVNPDRRPSSVAPLVKWAAACDPPPDEASRSANAGVTP
jgi:Protein kinase domain/Cyclic nucleotide-binding domain